MLNEIFSDYFAQKNNFLTRIDARIKMLFVFGAVAVILFSCAIRPMLILSILCFTLLLSIRIPFKVIFLKMCAPLGMGIIIVLIQVFSRGSAGFEPGLLIMSKIAACVSLVLFLSMATPVNAIFDAAAWFKIPKTWVEIAAITYRYVFVLIEDAITIRDAQKVRLGYNSLFRSVQSLASLTGSVFIRAYDQSLATYEAMRARGYLGSANLYSGQRLTFKDALWMVIFSVILFLLIMLNHV